MPWYVFWVCNRTWMESTGHVRQMGKSGLLPQWQPGHSRSRCWQAPVSQPSQPGPVSLPGSSQTIYSSGVFATLTFTVSNGCPRTRPTAPAVARRWYEWGLCAKSRKQVYARGKKGTGWSRKAAWTQTPTTYILVAVEIFQLPYTASLPSLVLGHKSAGTKEEDPWPHLRPHTQ